MFRLHATNPFTCKLLAGCLLFVALSIAVRTSTAQTPEFLIEKWTAADGLPSSTITGLARTQDGFLWVGTDHGAARFDGSQFSVFTRENLPGLRSDNVEHMGAGPDSQVYLGTWKGGFTVLAHGHARAFGKAEGTKSNVVPVVLPVGADEAWFGTDNGYLYHYSHGSIAEVGSLPRVPIYALTKTPDGTVWIGSQSGLFYLSHGAAVRYQPQVPLPGDGIFDLAVTDSGRLFASNDRGLFLIQGDHWSSWTTENGLPSNRVQVLAAAPGDGLWIGTTMGVARLTQGRARGIQTPLCSVDSLLFDREKSLWIGCEENRGLLRLMQPPVRMLYLSGRLHSVGTRSLTEDESGAIWMATGQGLVQWRNNRSRLYGVSDGLPSSNIWLVSVGPDGSVWIGTENGFARIQNGRIRSFRTKEPGPDDPIDSIVQDSSGTLWVGADRGLLRRRPGQMHLEEIPNMADTIWSLREDRAGNIWAATKHHGLVRFSGDSEVHFTTECGLASNMVYSTTELSNGDIWTATEGGLSRIRNGKCASIRAENGLPPGRITAVERDSQGHLWLTAPTMVIALEIAEANRVADHGGVLSGARFLGADEGFGEGMLGAGVLNSTLLHSSGEMWFVTRAGVGRVNPAVLRTAAPALKPQLDSLISDTGDHDLTRPVIVQPGDRRLHFAYSAPSLIGAKTREFRYRLVGFDDVWRAGGKQRDAVYTSLPPGTYRFQIGVRRPFESWNDISAPLEIHILPHFYRTWWWYALLALASLALLLLAYKLRVVTLRRQYAALMTERLGERSRLARELHDTLAQGMVAIHMQIEAAQVLLDVDPGSIGKHLENLESIAREASVETRLAIAALRRDAVDNTALRDVLCQAALNFSRACTIPLAADIGADLPQVSQETSHEIVRFVEEALANVRLHSEAKQAHLTACKSGKSFVFEVRDDGKGFQLSTPNDSMADHFGITGMKERARRINGRFQMTTGLGEGTRVVLEVPVRSRRSRNNPLI